MTKKRDPTPAFVEKFIHEQVEAEDEKGAVVLPVAPTKGDKEVSQERDDKQPRNG